MLEFKKTGDIIEIKETTMSFTDTKVSYWYIDVKRWKQSSTGRQNASVDRDMTPSAIMWAKKYYLPKVA